MKKVVLAMVVLSLLIFPVADAGNTYELVGVSYPIVVDGVELVSQYPILNYTGITYIPLRKVSEATKATVTWDSVNKKALIDTPEIAAAQEPLPTYTPQPTFTPRPTQTPHIITRDVPSGIQTVTVPGPVQYVNNTVTITSPPQVITQTVTVTSEPIYYTAVPLPTYTPYPLTEGLSGYKASISDLSNGIEMQNYLIALQSTMGEIKYCVEHAVNCSIAKNKTGLDNWVKSYNESIDYLKSINDIFRNLLVDYQTIFYSKPLPEENIVSILQQINDTLELYETVLSSAYSNLYYDNSVKLFSDDEAAYNSYFSTHKLITDNKFTIYMYVSDLKKFLVAESQ